MKRLNKVYGSFLLLNMSKKSNIISYIFIKFHPDVKSKNGQEKGFDRKGDKQGFPYILLVKAGARDMQEKN